MTLAAADEDVLSAAITWLNQGERVVLITVAATFGSSPRPPGSLMAATLAGTWTGSISGGCIESHLVKDLRENWPDIPKVVDYGVSRESALRAGLPCGGKISLLVEPLSSAAPLDHIVAVMRSRRVATRHVCLSTGEASIRPADFGAEFSFDGENLAKVFGPTWRLVLIGAGQVSRYVLEFARMLDYQVIICDPREDYVRNWGDASLNVDSGMPDDVVRRFADDARCAVVALTHDPSLDDLALFEALQSEAFYVGALGSRSNSAKRIERLKRQGATEAQLARLHSPVGAPIGGKTPQEIALSVVAGLNAARHGLRLEARRESEVEHS